MKRRDFLSFIAATSMFSNTAYALSKESEQRILILIELQGANDGLNTVIPFKHSKYKNLRPSLFIKGNDILTISDLGLDSDELQPALTLTELFIPVSDKQCEIIEGEDEADSGRLLAMRLREEKII